MASFRFTPFCCCKFTPPVETNQPCIPECATIYDGLLKTDLYPVSNLLPIIRNARRCSRESWWHGFYIDHPNYSSTTAYPTSDITLDKVAMNSVICVVGYSAGIRQDSTGITEGNWSDTIVHGVEDKLKATNNSTGYGNYIVYDPIDQRYHFNPNVTEPAWIMVYSVPYNNERYPLEFPVADDTEASWNAATPQLVDGSSISPYKRPADCGFYPLTVRADFATAKAAWEQYHTGSWDVHWYVVNADTINSWVTGLAGTGKHYGSDYFGLGFVGFEAGWGNRTYDEQRNSGNSINAYGCEATTESISGRFLDDAPTFTPMLQTGRYTIDRIIDQYNLQNPTVLANRTRNIKGNPAGLPSKWRGEDLNGVNGFAGFYATEGAGMAYASAATGSFGISSNIFPLGKYRYSKPTELDNVSNVTWQTGPVQLREGTLIKTVNDFTWDDFKELKVGKYTSGGVIRDYAYTPPNFDIRYYEPGRMLGFYPWYLVFRKMNTTPSALVHGNLVFGCRAQFYSSQIECNRWGYGTYLDATDNSIHSDRTCMGWVGSRQPGSNGEVIEVNTARFEGYDIGSNNTYMKSFDLEWRTIQAPQQPGQTTPITYHIPKIPTAILNDITADLWVWTNYINTPDFTVNKTFYCYPCIYVTGYAYVNRDTRI